MLVAVPKVLGGACLVLLNVVILHHSRPEEYGTYSLCVAGILLVDAILGSAFDLAVLRLAPVYKLDNPRRARALQSAAILLKAIPVIVIICGLVLAKVAYIYILSAGAAAAMLMLRSAQNYLQVEGRFGLYGALDIVHNCMRLGGISILLLAGTASPESLILFFLIGPLVALVFALKSFGRELDFRSAVRADVVWELLVVVGWFALTFGITSIVSRLDLFLLRTWSDLREVGIFSAGQTFAMLPEAVGGYIAIVLGPRVIPYCRDGRFPEFFQRFHVFIVLVCVALYASAFFGIEFIAPYLFSASFSRSSTIILILLPGGLTSLVCFPLTYTFLMFARPRFLFAVDCFFLPVLCIAFFLVVPRYGAIGAAWLSTVSRLTRAGIAWFAAWDSARSAEQLTQLATGTVA